MLLRRPLATQCFRGEISMADISRGHIDEPFMYMRTWPGLVSPSTPGQTLWPDIGVLWGWLSTVVEAGLPGWHYQLTWVSSRLMAESVA